LVEPSNGGESLQLFTHSGRRQRVLGASRGGELAQTLHPIGGEQRQSFTREPRPMSPFPKLETFLVGGATREQEVAPGSLVCAREKSLRIVFIAASQPRGKHRASAQQSELYAVR